ncbi:hypothetical protein ACFE04_022515 [Oxalis oulophora]
MDFWFAPIPLPIYEMGCMLNVHWELDLGHARVARKYETSKEKKLEGIMASNSWVLILMGEEMSIPQCLWSLGTKPAMTASLRLLMMFPKRPRKASFTVEYSSFKTSWVATIMVEEAEVHRVEVKTTKKEVSLWSTQVTMMPNMKLRRLAMGVRDKATTPSIVVSCSAPIKKSTHASTIAALEFIDIPPSIDDEAIPYRDQYS